METRKLLAPLRVTTTPVKLPAYKPVKKIVKRRQPAEIEEEEEETDMSKNIWENVSRGASPHMFSPFAVKLRGIDTDEPKDAVLVDITSRHGQEMIEKLALNIILVGQIHAVSINKDGGEPFATAGRRRILAFRLIWEWVDKGDKRAQGLKEKPLVACMTKRGNEADQMLLMVSENEHAVADTPMSKARKANRLLALKISEADVAVAFGVTRQAVDQWKKLIDLSMEVQEAIDQGIVAASTAVQLAALPRAEQGAKLKEMVAEAQANGTKVTVKTARAAAKGQESSAPGVRAVRKAYQAVKDEELDLSEVSAELLLGWVLGEVAASRIKGLTKVLNS